MRVITRQWVLKPNTARVTVLVRHPECGDLARGTITHLPADGTAPCWGITDYDHQFVGVVTGDYLDAERALLDATTELDN
jgi:hypothetical protein